MGLQPETANNAIALARKPSYDKLLREFPNTLIHASEHFVGLPDGQMGNSEVGHLNIGAGRIVQMDITRIDALDRGRRVPEESDHRAMPCSVRGKADGSSSLRPGLRRRRSLAPGASLRPAAHRARIRAGACLRARIHGRPRHAPTPARDSLRSSSRRCASTAWARSPRQRPLLRDGPRQALGARAQGLRRHGERQGRGRRICRPRGPHQGDL